VSGSRSEAGILTVMLFPALGARLAGVSAGSRTESNERATL
jgi:hypothetical protein